MKVLMLGWEFPPHISGGLGTACAGLTQALEKELVDILFVVPKLHGGETAERTRFINASEVPFRQKKEFVASDVQAVDNNPSSTDRQTEISEESVQQSTSTGVRTTIEVPSYLTAYNSPEQIHATGLQKWNYVIPDKSSPALPASSGIPLDQNEPRKGIRYIKEPYRFSGTYGSDLLTEVQRYAEAAAEIAKRNSFDIIHAHDWITYQAGIAAKKISGKPLVVHVHATEVDRSGATVNTKVFEIEKDGMTQADKVVVVSHWTKNIAVRHYQIAEDKIEVVHNGINPRNAESLPAAVPPFDSPIITFLGRITHQKGPMYFVEAARKVVQQFPEAHFVVAGSGDQLPTMIERIAQLRLSRNFHFTGFLKNDDINKVWAMSSVYVMPSVSEPFGIAPLEAIQAGVPVILSKQAGVSEVMPHAIKVDFWDADAFAEAICNVLRFKSLANTLRKNGSEEIKKITWDKAAKKLTTLYYELSNSRSKRSKSDTLLSGAPAKKASHAPLL